MPQYSAKLLFQWRPVRNGVSRKRRVCEERIVTFEAKSPQSALAIARDIGKESEYSEEREDCTVFFEFVGIMELRDVSLAFTEGEVWYEMLEMVSPMERRGKILPQESELDALREKAPSEKGRLRYC